MYLCYMKRGILTLLLTLLTTTAAAGQTRDELLGKVTPTRPEWSYSDGHWLRTAAYDDFRRMQEAARADSVELVIVSAFRSFDRQRIIWERKWNAPERSHMTPVERARHILRYSSMPSTSRHHWGTDIDLNSVENAYFRTERGKRMLQWLETHAAEYNFFRPYTDGRTKGYASEPWHWSHKPTAEKMLDVYLETISEAEIKDFEGADTADSLDVIENWVKLD